jgi:phage tail protein X
VSDDADRIILRNTVFSEDHYRDYWDSLLRKRPRNENNLLYAWKQAAERESRQRLRRFLLISVALLGLLSAIVGEQLGLWSLRTVVDRAVEMVRHRIAVFSGIAASPEAVGGRDQGREVAPLARRTLPVMPSPSERSNAGAVVPLAPQETTRASVAPAMPPSSQFPLVAPGQPGSGVKELAIKKVVVVRAGDTLSHILAQEYGEYTKAVVDLVSEANPGLRNIHFLEIGQRLILPERPE